MFLWTIVTEFAGWPANRELVRAYQFAVLSRTDSPKFVKKFVETSEPRVPAKIREWENRELRNKAVEWEWEEHEQERGEWRKKKPRSVVAATFTLVKKMMKLGLIEIGLLCCWTSFFLYWALLNLAQWRIAYRKRMA